MRLVEIIEQIPGVEINDVYTSNSFEIIKEGTPYMITYDGCDTYSISSKYYALQEYTDLNVFLDAIRTRY